MSPLRFCLIHLFLGFLIGGAAAVAISLTAPLTLGFSILTPEGGLFIYGMGSSFSAGSLATALSFSDAV